MKTTTTATLLAPPQAPLSPRLQQQQAPRTKHLRFHYAKKGKTNFLFLSFLLKDNFRILKVYRDG